MEPVFYYLPFCPRSYLSFLNFKKAIAKASIKSYKVKKVVFCIRDKRLVFPPFIEFKGSRLKGFYLKIEKIDSFLRG